VRHFISAENNVSLQLETYFAAGPGFLHLEMGVKAEGKGIISAGQKAPSRIKLFAALHSVNKSRKAEGKKLLIVF